MTKLAVVLVRGTVSTHPDVRKTLDLLRLRKKHVCVVVEDNEVNRGMLKKVKDYVTYGPITQETFKELVEKRAELKGGIKASEKKIDASTIAKEFFADNIKLRDFETKYEIKPYFRLHPPKGGFEKGGIKKPYTMKGALGERDQESMNSLVQRML